jgi:hypothetical protein
MKKRLVVFLLVCVMALSFAAPAIANAAVVSDPVNVVVGGETTTDTEITIIHHRWCGCCGRLQFRVWGAVSMKWLTAWQYM